MNNDSKFEQVIKEISNIFWKNTWEDMRVIQSWQNRLPWIFGLCALGLLLVLCLFIYGIVFPDSLKSLLLGIK